jgi:MoaA/NifB/PqqE/SkfB family radical SAM enzyme
MTQPETSPATQPLPIDRTIARRILSLFRKPPRVRMLYLEVTHRCNARCVTCYTKAGKEKPDVLTFDEKKSVIAQAKALGAKTVSLSGSGEPLLYERLFDLIDYIRHLGMQAVVFTNGTLLDERTAEQLIARGVIAYVKLYSLNPEVFDRMMGRTNAYRWTPHTYMHTGQARQVTIPNGLKLLLDAQSLAGAGGLVRIETLITRLNAATLGNVARFCKELDLVLHLETPVFTGRAIENRAEIALEREGYETLYRELLAILGDEYFSEHRAHPCPVERNPVVWTNGDVGFCSSRPAGIGNVRDTSLESLFIRARRAKRREDRRIAACSNPGRYFRTCPARQYFEAKHRLTCDY